MRFRRHARAPLAAAAAGAVLVGLLQATAWAEEPLSTKPPVRQAEKTDPAAVPPAKRTGTLGKGWEKSKDTAWTTTGDAQGFHLLTATESSGYAWKTLASLAEPGFDADQWIGNACVTASGKRAVVVYAPRTFTNDPKLMARGGFTAVVDLADGTVTKLKVNASLSYYNPGCGTGEEAVLTQSPGEDRTQTRLIRVDAATGKVGKAVVVNGQVTSSVPAGSGKIAAASGRTLVEIDADGDRKKLATTGTVPYRIHKDSDGGYVFLERVQRDGLEQAETALVRRWADRKVSKLGSGPLGATGLTRRGGQVYLTGDVTDTADLPKSVTRLAGTRKDATLSTTGAAIVQHTVWADGKGSPKYLQPEKATDARPVKISTTVRGTGRQAGFTVTPLASKSPRWATSRTPSPLLDSAKGRSKAGDEGGIRTDSAGMRALSAEDPGDVTGSRTEAVESERICSVPRNDPRNQAMQPKPRQVEWAVDKAISGNLNIGATRPANWKNLGMPAYAPQSLFPNPVLDGGGRVPAQVMLGITAQESNMWQAARSAVPGVTGNTLIGNYYGIDYYDGDTANDWDVDWSDGDCGYGITQVTDHMRLAGREHGKGGTAWDYDKQRAVALDYAANVAAGLGILVSKWNQTKQAGLVVHDGNPAKLENWFFALWAYNSGFYENVNGNGPWGVGWANNPANPEWDAGRMPFMEDRLGNEDASAAARPQHWPYPEKVLGFAAHPPAFIESPGTMVAAYRAAWWNGTGEDATVAGSAKYNRARVKPPEDLFCGPYNWCDPSKISDGAQNEAGQGPCDEPDFKCWFHQSVQWKTDCSYSCGNEFFRFTSPDYDAEQADGTAYPPNCSRSGLPSGAIIVDDLPEGTPSVRPGCANSDWTNEGTFTFDFGDGEAGVAHDGTTVATTWPSKVDLHQLGAGFGGHFYFGHSRADDAKGRRLEITGTWKLDRTLDSAAKVYVHLPDHGAQEQNAYYEIKTAQGWKQVGPVDQYSGDGMGTNRWLAIGVWQFKGVVPEVRLSTIAPTGTGDDDVAFDAVAFLPGDYSGTPEISFPDADPNAPETDYSDQPMSAVPTPPMNFGSLSTVTAKKAPAVRQAPGAQETLVEKLAANGTTAEFESCPIVPGATYNRYTACLTSSTPLTFVVIKDGVPLEAKFNVHQQIQLYKNESGIDEIITVNPVSINPGLQEITLEWRSTCSGPCSSGAQQVIGSRTWAAGGADLHPLTIGVGHWWTGTTGVGNVGLSSLLTGITPLGGATTTWADDDLRIRCDVIMGKEEVPETKAGCVFSSYTPTMTLNSKKRPAASALYWLLMEKLESHPGSKKHNSPLTRQADGAIADANRAKICDSTFIGHPTNTSDNPSCDEYPFAKSRQSGGGTVSSGSACANFYAEKQSNGRWTLAYDPSFGLPTWKEVCGRGSIPLSQNTGAGGELGRFTTAMRLHDADGYFVETPGFAGCTPTLCDLP